MMNPLQMVTGLFCYNECKKLLQIQENILKFFVKKYCILIPTVVLYKCG